MNLSSTQLTQGLQQLPAYDVLPQDATFQTPTNAFVFQFQGTVWQYTALRRVVFQVPAFPVLIFLSFIDARMIVYEASHILNAEHPLSWNESM